MEVRPMLPDASKRRRAVLLRGTPGGVCGILLNFEGGVKYRYGGIRAARDVGERRRRMALRACALPVEYTLAASCGSGIEAARRRRRRRQTELIREQRRKLRGHQVRLL